MKKIVVAAVALTLSATVMVAPAGSQEVDGGDAPVETTTTTVVEAPVETTTTTVAEEPEVTTTTIAEPVEGGEEPVEGGEEEAPVDDGGDLEILELPGESVAGGTLNFGVEFYENEAANCTGALSIGGGNMNVVRNEAGDLGALYGTEATGSGTAGLFMIELGAVPAAVAILSVSDANCEFDAIGVGNWEASATTMSLDGVGAGVYPGKYTEGEFISSFQINTEITGTNGPASLDLSAAEAFLTRSRG